MYLGKMMELSPGQGALLTSRSIPTPRRCWPRSRSPTQRRTAPASGWSSAASRPIPINPPPGCRFHTRCPRATEICSQVEPPLAEYAGGHLAACHHPLNVSETEIAGATYSSLSPLSAGRLMPSGEEAPAGGGESGDTNAAEADSRVAVAESKHAGPEQTG